jgi:cytoskeletal protein RodZ
MMEEGMIEVTEPQAATTTEEVSGLLKRVREEKGLSVQEVETAIRIPKYYLQLLEGGGDTRLLADVLYLIPFLRSYSAFLGLDPASTVSRFIAAIHRNAILDEPEQSAPRRSLSRVVVVLLVLAGLALLSFLWVTGDHRRISWQ